MISPNRSPSIGAELLARIGIGAAIVSLLALFWSTNNLFCQIELIRMETERSAAEYMANSDRVWAKMRSVVDDVPPNNGGKLMHRFGRDAKPKQNDLRGSEFHALNQCQKCARLSCNPGLTGPPGAPGEDGVPGMPGKLGAPGVDGVDIHEDLLPDLPCIVCPAGSQGPRGLHGERGLPGPAGIPGRIGVDGRPGPNGPRGISGSVGRKGNDGMPGEAGPPGETVVGGLGVKGPPGKPGPEGLVGLQGLHGRPSNIAGQPGRQGPRGAVGLPGEPGEPGPPGPPAPPGDIGLTPNYCPMHCPFRARGQTVFVPRPDDENNNNDYVFPPILMMSHDEVIGDGTDGDGEDIYDATGEEDGAKTVQKSETMAGDQKEKEKA